jgi:sulfite oxidase
METAGTTMKPDLIIRTDDPLNIEGRAELLMGHETPVEHFFVRSHGGIPAVDLASWQLTIDGLVRAPLTLDYDTVIQLPAETRRLVLECAGNGRRFFDPPARGLEWGTAAIGQSRWTGTRLDGLLDRAGLAPGAAHVIFHPLGAPAAGKPPYIRSLPLGDVRARGVLLAWAMGGETLLPSHGFPLRVVVPGWTGQHWVKWISRVEVSDAPAAGLYMEDEYLAADGTMLRGGHVKSLITSPADGTRLRHGMLSLSGIAWAGEREVARVEVSLDGGRTWRAATLSSHGGSGAWRRWDLNIELGDEPGALTIAVRATDDRGDTQPERSEWNPLGYLWNGYHVIGITRVR